MFSGMPLFGAAQAGVLFPLNWFYLIFSIPVATNAMMLSAYMIAALGAYLFARRSGASIGGAAVTSLVWQCSAFMIAKVGQTNVVQTAALFPWVLWAVDAYGMTGRRTRALLLALIVPLQFFAGHQQTFTYSFLIAAAYAVLMWRVAPRTQRRSYAASLIFLASGITLSAVQLLPTVELLRRSLRASASYDFFSSFSMPPRFILTLFAPFLMGGGDGNLFRAPYIGPAFAGEYIAYVGSLTLMLAVLALILRRDARTIFWAAVAVICLALAVGRFLPFNTYKLVYYLPVLNLFRVPARHLMEVEFALAVLAGRGLTALSLSTNSASKVRVATLIGGAILLLTFLSVTSWRPANFQLARVAPVSVLRAPELFIPIVVALFGAIALWFFARNAQKGRATSFIFAVLLLDLFLWGQSSGWRYSPTPAHPLWRQPEAVQLLHDLRQQHGNEPYRILTEVQPFFINTGADETEKYKLGDFMLALQPDTYVMHGVENAAGYDGFGLARYSRLADDMKLWGEVTDAQRSVRGPGREFDILNVQYLIKQSPLAEARRRAAANFTHAIPATAEIETEILGGIAFAKKELNAPSLINGERLVFTVPPTQTNAIALVTSLAWAADVGDGEVVGVIRLHTADGKDFEFPLRAGEDTAEWSHDRPDLKSKMMHKRAEVATSYTVNDPAGNFESHSYLARFSLPQTVNLESGEIEVAKVAKAPQLTLDVKRVSLLNGDTAEQLRGDLIEKVGPRDSANEKTASANQLDSARWKLAAQSDYLRIYENTHALPRAWLAHSEVVSNEQQQLETIRSGKLPDGTVWDPLKTALVEAPTGIAFKDVPADTIRITREEPNRLEMQTNATSPALLVVSENHYPGWRAYVDGQAVDVMRVDYNLRGVALGAGNHQVSFVYRPKSVFIGALISLLTLIGLLVWTRMR